MVRYSFPNKVVLVTGGSRSMGAAILEAFAAAGAVCVVNYFDDPDGQNRRDAEATAERLRTLKAAAVHLFDADVSRYESVERLMQHVGRRGGRPRHSRQQRRRAARPHGQEDDAGRVADACCRRTSTACSTARSWGRRCCATAAGSSTSRRSRAWSAFTARPTTPPPRPASSRLTKVMAKEVARRGITVNAVAPGVIQTPMLAGLKPEVLADYEKQIPVGRVGGPEDVAHAVLFLACEESGYITGQTLPITGGWF